MTIACLVTQSRLTLWDPLDCSLPVSSVHGTFQARILECIAIFLLQEIFPTQGLNPHLLCLLHRRRILYLLHHWGSPSQPSEGTDSANTLIMDFWPLDVRL